MPEIGELLKDGKTKRIYATTNDGEAVLYFKDEAIAFHGLKRGLIVGKGEVNNTICAHIFPMLEKNGVATHFIRKLDARQCLVRRCEMIPLSVTVRNLAAGSLTKRLGIPAGTVLEPKVVEFSLRNFNEEHPLINNTHIEAMNIATRAETEQMHAIALKVNSLLQEFMQGLGVELIDLHLRFGRYNGELLLADELTPDTCRFWDIETHEPLDIDRFREGLGDDARGYREILHRMMGMETSE